jgi:hypothetical protein
MDITKILREYYDKNEWCCGDTYDSLEWYDTTIPKPTKEEFDLLYKKLQVEEVRQKRNELLNECDHKLLVDYPNTNKEAWVQYRQELRDFPSNWVGGMEFPIKPE